MNFLQYLNYVQEKTIKIYPNKKKDKYSDRKDLHFLINLYKSQGNNNITEISSDVDIELNALPDNDDILKSTNFMKRYHVFLKIIFSALLINVSLFKIYRDTEVFMNLYDMKNCFLKKKKTVLQDLTSQIDSNTKTLNTLLEFKYTEYQKIFSITTTQIKVIDKVVSIIDKLVEKKILKENESVITLIMPFFYKYQNYIETYTMG